MKRRIGTNVDVYVHGFLRDECVRGVQCVCFDAVDEAIVQIPANDRGGRYREERSGMGK